MLVGIDKIQVGERIRKDFGDIGELADDIKRNGLINPIVVNKDFLLLAGERRLRACKMLGMEEVEVNMIETRDKEHEFDIEISENEVRKEFSRSERARSLRIALDREMKQAEIRKKALLSGSGNATTKKEDENPSGEENASGNVTTTKGRKSCEIVGDAFGMSGTNVQREIKINEHKEEFTPEDFADWDEGRLSTNKAYKMLKQKLADAEKKSAEKDKAITRLQDDLNGSEVEKEMLQNEFDEWKAGNGIASSHSDEDYNDLLEQVKELRLSMEKFRAETGKAKAESERLRKEKDQLAKQIKEAEEKDDGGSVIESVRLFNETVVTMMPKKSDFASLSAEEREGFLEQLNLAEEFLKRVRENM